MSEKPTIFITGVTGHIGGATFQHLNKTKVNIKVGIRDASKQNTFKESGVEPVVFDMGNKESTLSALKGVNRLLVVPPNSKDRSQLAIRVIEAAKEAGVGHVVLFSVPQSSEKRISFHKEFAPMEEVLQKSGMGWTIMAAPYFQEMYLNYKETVRLPFGQDGVAPSASVWDIGRAIAKVLEQPTEYFGKAFLLTGPEMLSGELVAKELSEAYGKQIKYTPISPEESKQDFLKMGLEQWQAQGCVELLLEYAARRVPLTSHIKDITGKAPRTLKETAQAALQAE
jgi:uncharacterized protein YbjT (DUF2867 family)